MQTGFKLAYGLGVGLLFVLSVVMGARLFYDQPEEPIYPNYPAVSVNLNCDFTFGQCTRFAPNKQQEERITLDEARTMYPDEFVVVERLYEVQQEYEAAQEEFHDDDVRRTQNVLAATSILGALAIAAGLVLYQRVEAMPMGLLLGGLGSVIYGFVESRRHYEEIGAAPVFLAAVFGFVVLLAAGYWFLRPRSGLGGG
jgi:hypothetical protein